jgi:hypothetical protein
MGWDGGCGEKYMMFFKCILETNPQKSFNHISSKILIEVGRVDVSYSEFVQLHVENEVLRIAQIDTTAMSCAASHKYIGR